MIPSYLMGGSPIISVESNGKVNKSGSHFPKHRLMMNKIWLTSTTILNSLTLLLPFKTMTANNMIDLVFRIYPLCHFLTPKKPDPSQRDSQACLVSFQSHQTFQGSLKYIYIWVPVGTENPLGYLKIAKEK